MNFLLIILLYIQLSDLMITRAIINQKSIKLFCLKKFKVCSSLSQVKCKQGQSKFLFSAKLCKQMCLT